MNELNPKLEELLISRDLNLARKLAETEPRNQILGFCNKIKTNTENTRLAEFLENEILANEIIENLKDFEIEFKGSAKPVIFHTEKKRNLEKLYDSVSKKIKN